MEFVWCFVPFTAGLEAGLSDRKWMGDMTREREMLSRAHCILPPCQ